MDKNISINRSFFFAFLTILAFAAGLLLGYVVWGRGVEPAPVAVTTVTATPTTAQAVRYDIPTEGFPSKGPADAEITLVEFSDYQCPYCKQWYDQVESQLMEAYPGKIRLVYRSFPLTSIHPEALPAAIAAYCAGQQGKYFEYHDALFGEAYGLNADAYQQYAADLSLNIEAFNACLVSDQAAQFIQDDMDFSINLGIRSTPTFFINGLALIGAQPIGNFQQVIDKELAGEIP